MRSDDMLQTVLGLGPVSRMVGQDVSHPTQPEDAVCDKHASLVPIVKVPEDVFRSSN